MNKNILFGAILFLLLFFLCAAFFFPVHERLMPVVLGDETVVIHVIEQGKGKSFIHLHQNEITALRAARLVVKTEGGRVLTLHHHGQRNIVFNFENKRYEFDPNRIFTDEGIKKTLTQGGQYSVKAHSLVRDLAKAIKMQLPEGRIIAVHNNQSYSLRDYYKGQSLETDAQALYVASDDAHSNFYLVTKPADFEKFKQLKMNSILQAAQANDDGSLSIYLASRQYVNVEAGYNALAAQVHMLRNA